ncbi:DEAD/DEAH box helicase [Bacillus sp. JNUCC-24]|uniref:DEAD/DEAH box helicase n=1 Tax=Bacillus safensis TaxID=561879 RepID=UPI000F1A21BF|nr:DEAD/DEAH box helicase [Bacillus safensis]QNH47152.1 DEAD/DEAH box helicase [Bacillus sp. PAMC28571]QNK45010.1 DEAD/DEAH box helicase [Bacillus sp. PAMC22265]QWS50118.1 DEAD/DEAH box helicase [Bacillus sp. JNUCC-24]WBL27991.1 ComF operon protein 1 [Bacillus safensis]
MLNMDKAMELMRQLHSRHLLTVETKCPQSNLDWLEEKGLVNRSPAIERKANGFTCCRCGVSHKRYFAHSPCEVCQKGCVYCRSCIMMGKAAECGFLYEWTGPQMVETCRAELTWQGELSKGQKRASERMIEAIKNKFDLLVWAVCGAGKTEVLFHGIEYALNQGMRVCIATPRTDVVLELEPRLRKAFQGVTITVLYGGSSQRFQITPLVITTTHQLMRYKNAFDVLIVDEVDAFPYSMDERLQFAVLKAMRKNRGVRIYLSATPSKKMTREVSRGKLEAIKIPLRFHEQPLPVPTFHWIGHWKKKLKKNQLPPKVMNWMQRHIANRRRILLFVPSIATMKKVTKILREQSLNVEGVSADDPDRKQKVQHFRDYVYDVLVTTTILERGVTIPNVQVGVLGSESTIFTESALVQISGRVGRHPDYCTGDVFLFHFGLTRSMKQAKKHIAKMNDTAAKEFSEKQCGFN